MNRIRHLGARAAKGVPNRGWASDAAEGSEIKRPKGGERATDGPAAPRTLAGHDLVAVVVIGSDERGRRDRNRPKRSFNNDLVRRSARERPRSDVVEEHVLDVKCPSTGDV
jgi:hypothetical protein